ncbi:metal-dependent transcriptional regulator [Leucobacter komagatae]|uniref:Manganese transport regulator n=1 Tax=Leucobacter komagatae TaxID=55969 RepID=A0A0D0IQC6_9MICO|nr:metal-dependent transcriptional regulator [Leucobacter komagatae]KIP53232.1 transcriptional regulator [Leucobacter komagatae]
MSVENITASMQNYLKVIWSLEEWSDTPITNSAIAEAAGVRLSTVSDALRKLADSGLIDHQRYGTVTLTPEGRELAVVMTRRHRLIETFLVRMLDYSWDEVHDEADRLEHAVSDELVNRIDRVLDYPKRDPHGDPIPSAEGLVHKPVARLLTEIEAPCRVRVERISDSDPEMLQYFASRGIIVDAELELLEGEPYSETTAVSVAGTGQPVLLGKAASDSVWAAQLG